MKLYNFVYISFAMTIMGAIFFIISDAFNQIYTTQFMENLKTLGAVLLAIGSTIMVAGFLTSEVIKDKV